MRRRASRLLVVVIALCWLAGQSLPIVTAAPMRADASACASPGFVLQRAPLSDGGQDARAAAPLRFGDSMVQPQSPVVADYGIAISDSPDPILPGNLLTYTITVFNNGPGDADGIVTGVIPSGTTFVSMTNANISGCWTCSTTPPVGGTGLFACASPICPVGETEELVLTVLVTGAAPLGSQIALTASVTGAVTDPASGNDSATAFTTVPAATPTITPPPTPPGTPTQTLTPTLPPTRTVPPATTATATPVPSATPTPTVPPTKVTSDDKSRPKTETQRQQDDHTNQLGRDDYHTEGNVVEVFLDAVPPYAVIATRDGLVQVLLNCEDGCPAVRVGDYLQADGVKENEGLFNAEDVTISR